MSAPAPELHPIVWPDPSPLQHWWTHVMGRPRLHPDQSETPVPATPGTHDQQRRTPGQALTASMGARGRHSMPRQQLASARRR